MSSEPDRPIEELLDQAGRDAQPRSSGWDGLPARLAATRQVAGHWYRRWPWLTGAAAMVAAAVGLAIYFNSGTAVFAGLAAIQVVPQDVEITVFNEAETDRQALFMPTAPDSQQQQGGKVKSGMALVKDHRLVLNLRRGDNVVRFTDVAATIDPTSVRFVSDTDPLGTTVVEQNFEYDLATAAALLKRYIDKKVTCVGKDGQEIGGYLCSYDDGGIVLAENLPRKDAPDRKTQTVSRDQVRAIRMAEVPKDLFVKPTLVWKLRTEREGRHDTTLAYACGNVKWEADYVAVVTPGSVETGDQLDLQGWVTLDNRSGSTYRDARIKIIAGDVNRVADPWAPVSAEWSGNVYLGMKFGLVDSDGIMDTGKRFQEKSFFEYHLYTLSAPSTVKDRQIKQLKLLKADQIKAVRRYVFDAQADPRRVQVRLEFKNEESNSMGMPLPKGRVRLAQRDTDGELVPVGEDRIDHTPKDEELKLKVGFASEVVGERTTLDTRRPSERQEVSTIRQRVRNHKSEPIRARCVEHLRDGVNWSIIKTDAPWTRENVNTVNFDVVVGANEEKTITYTVDYQW